jgi:hypothetical protein
MRITIVNDYGKKERERLLRNENREELAENVAGWLLFITVVFLAVHVIIVMWERL